MGSTAPGCVEMSDILGYYGLQNAAGLRMEPEDKIWVDERSQSRVVCVATFL
jgi:hypothetical protein